MAKVKGFSIKIFVEKICFDFKNLTEEYKCVAMQDAEPNYRD